LTHRNKSAPMLRHLLTQRSCKLSNQRRFLPAVFRLCAVQNL